MKRIDFACLSLICLAKILCAEDPSIKFERISIEQGLSQNIVQCILQDNKGFMWIGTDDGLNRYDGYSFITYNNEPHNPYSLSHNRVRSIYEDHRGILWIGTMGGGLNKFIREEGKFLNYTADPKDQNALSDNTVLSIYEDRAGILWIGTYEGLNKFDREKEKFTHYYTDNSAASYANFPYNNWVTSIYEDSRERLWIGTYKGLNRFDRKEGRFTRYRTGPDDPDHSNNNKITAICEDRAGMLWIGTFGGLKIFDPQKGEFTPVENKPSYSQNVFHERVETIIRDHSGCLWIGTMNGLFRFNPGTDRFQYFQNLLDRNQGASSELVMSIYEDRSNIMWIGTYSGLCKFDNKKKKFTHYKLPANNLTGSNMILSIYEDRMGVLWLGIIEGGLARFSREKGTITNYINNPDDPASLSHNSVTSIFESSRGELWIGTERGLNKFAYRAKKFYRYMPDAKNPNTLSHEHIRTIIEDRSGALWIGTHDGLNKFAARSEMFTVYRNEPGNSNSLSHNTIMGIVEDQSGVLWIATYGGGVNKYERGTNRFTRYRHVPGDPYSLSNNKIYSLYEDRSGILWIGTNSGGLNKFDKKTGMFINYTKEDGLPNNVILGIMEDNQGNLWFSTNRGIAKFDPKTVTVTFRNYIIEDGLQGYEFLPGSYYKSKNGEMFFGGVNGFNAFYPENVRDNPYIPPVVITSFLKSAEGKKPAEPIPEIREVKLSHKDSFFSFKFAALDYTAPDRNKYKYKLEKFDDDWIQLDNKHDITFTGLPPGKYIFRVRGSNSDGVWNNKGAAVAIFISPPFWRTWWFILLMVILFLGLLVLVYRILTNSLKQKLEKERLAKELKLKADFTAMLVHDLRSPLTAVMGYSGMLTEMAEVMDIPKTGKVITRSSEKMLTLINDMLDISKFEAGKMTLYRKKATLFEIITDIIQIMRPLLDRKGITLVWEQDAGTREEVLFVDPERIGQVVSNLLSNAIKFTLEKGNIIIKLSRVEAGVEGGGHLREISVNDDGPGVPAEMRKYLFDKYAQLNTGYKLKGTGLGLAVSKMIIESHNGSIGFRPGIDGKGSSFFFCLPYPG